MKTNYVENFNEEMAFHAGGLEIIQVLERIEKLGGKCSQESAYKVGNALLNTYNEYYYSDMYTLMERLPVSLPLFQEKNAVLVFNSLMKDNFSSTAEYDVNRIKSYDITDEAKFVLYSVHMLYKFCDDFYEEKTLNIINKYQDIISNINYNYKGIEKKKRVLDEVIKNAF